MTDSLFKRIMLDYLLVLDLDYENKTHARVLCVIGS